MSEHTPPVGPPVDATPAQLPGPVTLTGRFGQVERLSAARHTADLWAAVRGSDEIWTYMSYGPFANEQDFGAWLTRSEQSQDPFCYAIVDSQGHAVGVLTLMQIRPAMRVVEVGHVVYSPALQRTPLATEAQYLIARYAIETLHYRRYEWKCDSLNAPSRRAAQRLGFVYEGIFRQHMIIKGRSRDTAWFSITENEWPERKAAFKRWLAPENFDSNGRQRKRLGEA